MFSVIKHPGKYRTGDIVRVITEEEYIALGRPTSNLGYHIGLYDKSRLDYLFGKEVRINCIRLGDSLADGGYVYYSLDANKVNSECNLLEDCIYLDDLVIDGVVKETDLEYNFQLGDIVKVSELDRSYSDFNESIGQITAIIDNKEFMGCENGGKVGYIVELETPGTINTPRAIISNIPIVVCLEKNITKWKQKMTYNNEKD